jgi:hypothetical protein
VNFLELQHGELLLQPIARSLPDGDNEDQGS